MYWTIADIEFNGKADFKHVMLALMLITKSGVCMSINHYQEISLCYQQCSISLAYLFYLLKSHPFSKVTPFYITYMC